MRKLFVLLLLIALAMVSQTSHAAKIAYMHGGTTPSAGDWVVLNQLVKLGNTYTLIPEATAGDQIIATANSCDLFIVSSSIGSGSARGKNLETITKPMIVGEEACSQNNSSGTQTTGNGPFAFGTVNHGTTAQTNILIDAAHAPNVLSANLSGSVTLFVAGATSINLPRVNIDTANPPYYSIDLPPASNGNVYQAMIAIDAGGKLAGGATAQARRVLTHVIDTAAPFLTPQGWRLFFAQVYWCLGQPLPQIPPTISPIKSSGMTIKDKAVYTSITLTNPDLNPVSFNAFKFTGSGAGIYSIESPQTWPLSVPGMQSGTVVVKALPTAEGISTGTLQLGYNNSASTLSTTLVTTTVKIDNTWLHQDVGTPTIAGDATNSGGTFTVTASGSDIWTAADQFHFMYQYANGNNVAVCDVTASQNLGTGTQNSWVKSGLMFRESTDAGSKFVDLAISTGNGVAMQARTATGASAVNVVPSTGGSANSVPTWLKLDRLGDTFTGYYSTDGSTWTALGSIVLPMNDVLDAGLCVTSHDNTQLNKTTFTNVSIAPPPNAVTSWTCFE